MSYWNVFVKIYTVLQKQVWAQVKTIRHFNTFIQSSLNTKNIFSVWFNEQHSITLFSN